MQSRVAAISSLSEIPTTFPPFCDSAHAIISLCARLFDGGAITAPSAVDFSIFTLIFLRFYNVFMLIF